MQVYRACEFKEPETSESNSLSLEALGVHGCSISTERLL